MKPQSKKDFPWWLVATGVLGLMAYGAVLTDEVQAQVLRTLLKGVQITVFVTLVGFVLASVIGMGVALMSLSRSLILRQIARF